MQKIQISDLRIGDVVLKFDGIDYQLPAEGVAIKNEEQIDSLKSKGIKYLYVKPSYGKEEFKEKVQQEPEKIVKKVTNFNGISSYVDLYHEAARIVRDVFKQAKTKKSLDLANYEALVNKFADIIFEEGTQLTGIIKLHEDIEYIISHALNVGIISGCMGKKLGFDIGQVKDIIRGGMLLDLGKVFISEAILNKKDKLVQQEIVQVVGHVEKAYKLLKLNDFPSDSLKILTDHHERIDGSGYPGKKKADEISVFGKIGAVADIYDAITTNRPHQKMIDPNSALKYLIKLSGVKIDKKIFESFVSVMGIYPSGSLVLLNSNEIAAVGKQIPNKPTTPFVVIFMNTKGVKRAPFIQDISIQNIKSRKIVKPVFFRDFKLPKEVINMIADMNTD